MRVSEGVWWGGASAGEHDFSTVARGLGRGVRAQTLATKVSTYARAWFSRFAPEGRVF